MTKLYAQPYGISTKGFFFESASDYYKQAVACRNNYGDVVEEFEIQFIDGENIDCDFAKVLGLTQCNLALFLQLIDDWGDSEKRIFIIANGECAYNFDPTSDSIGDIEVDIYEVESLKELAEQFVDDGLFGEIPTHLQNYIDLEAIARDLSVDYSMTEIANERLAYRWG